MRAFIRLLPAGILLACLLTLGGRPGGVAAIANPDSMQITAVYAFSGAINTGDLLVIARYRITYATLPSESASDAFLARFLRGVTDLNSTELISYNTLGYGQGIFSFYWSAAELTALSIEWEDTNNENYSVVLQGKPGVFPGSPPRATTTGIEWRDDGNTKNELYTDVVALATALENDAAWRTAGVDLITTSPSGARIFTTRGVDYFASVIASLQAMLPSLFPSSLTSPSIAERSYNYSYQNTLNNFWQDSGVNTAFTSLSTEMGVSAGTIRNFVGLVFVLFIIFVAAKLTQHIEFGLLSVAFSLPLMAIIGLMSLSIVLLIAAIGALGLGFVLFLNRA